jgi:hypothetical protein
VIVESVLSSITEAEIGTLLNGLDLEACDVLMKYVYRIMAKVSNNADPAIKNPSNNCAIILKIHAQLVEKAGLGSIVRVMTDRRQV